MNPAKIVVHVVERNGVLQIFKLFGKGVREARKPAHRHPHGEILALNVACGDVIMIGVAAKITVLRAPMHTAGLYRVSGLS